MRLGSLFPFDGSDDTVEDVADLARRGFQYFEPDASVLRVDEAPTAYFATRRLLRRAALVPEVMGGLVPDRLPVLGNDARWQELERHLSILLERAREVGATTLVLDSAQARRVPEGYPRDEAIQQLRYLLGLAADYAGPVKLAVLPLPRHPSSLLNSVAETVEMLIELGRPELQLCVEATGVGPDGEPWEDVAAAMDLLAHVRWSEPNLRDSPAMQDKLDALVEALGAAGYEGRLSLAPRPGVGPAESVIELDRLRALAARGR
jgi:sugar phosphate isomerase/epimerase